MENESGESKEDIDSVNKSRRELIKKYGAYTAPLVVSLLSPQQAYGANGGAIYSSVTSCVAAHTMTSNAAVHCVSTMAMHLG